MGEQERNNIREMVETAKYLAEHDQFALLLAKNTMDALKARCDLVKANKERPVA